MTERFFLIINLLSLACILGTFVRPVPSLGQGSVGCATNGAHNATILIPDTVRVIELGWESGIRPDSIAVFSRAGCVGSAAWRDGPFALSVAGYDAFTARGMRSGDHFRFRIYDISHQTVRQAFGVFASCTTVPEGIQAICQDDGVFFRHTVHVLRWIYVPSGSFGPRGKAQQRNLSDSWLRASAEAGAVHLKWKPAGGTIQARYFVQRRVVTDSLTRRPRGGQRWQTIGSIDDEDAGGKKGVHGFIDDALPHRAQKMIYRLHWVGDNGETHYSDEAVASRPAARSVRLRPPFPNPTPAQAIIQYALPTAKDVSLSVYDLLGRRVIQLNKGRQSLGRKSTSLDVTGLASGTYIVRLTADESVRSRKIVVIR
jgi:hypothetical protein